MPLPLSPVSRPVKVPMLSEICPLGQGKFGSSLEFPLQNPGCNRPKVWANSCPPYQSPKEASVSPVTLTGTVPPPGLPVGPEATVVGSGLVGIPDEHPRMYPPPTETRPK